MNMQRHTEATLDEFDGPFFPELIDRLNNLTHYGNFSVLELEEIVEKLHWRRLNRRKTSDGYIWFCALEFKVGDGRVLVCLPWSQDWQQRDKTSSDRSPAVYAQFLNRQEIDQVIRDLIRAIEDHPLALHAQRAKGARMRA